MKLARHAIHIDYTLLIVFVSLLSLGFVMMSSSSLHLGAKIYGNSMHYPSKQLLHIVFGLAIAALIYRVPIVYWQKSAPYLFVATLVMLVLVAIPGIGVEVNGARRWLALPYVRLQVAEVAKFTSIVYLASYLVRHKERIQHHSWGAFIPVAIFTGGPAVLLLLQPDFGSAVIILAIVIGVLFLAGAKLLQFTVLGTLGIIVSAFFIYLSPYRFARLKGFIDPWANAQDIGFQLVHALISFGRGEITGVGLGSGIQKLFYLPEANTDFLFAVIAEELGLLGVLLVIALFALLVYRIFVIASCARQVKEQFAANVAYGMGLWFGLQAFINMGVNMGVLPTKGLTLPLMSYGGSSMVTMCAAAALLLRIHSETRTLQPQRGRADE